MISSKVCLRLVVGSVPIAVANERARYRSELGLEIED
jgi:hypothetical protein